MNTAAEFTYQDWAEVETLQHIIRRCKGESWVRWSDRMGVKSAQMAIRIYLSRRNRTALACWTVF